jgi:hypothetical protein
MINDPEYKTIMPLEDICLMEGKAKNLTEFHANAKAEMEIQSPTKSSNLFISSSSALFNTAASSSTQLASGRQNIRIT